LRLNNSPLPAARGDLLRENVINFGADKQGVPSVSTSGEVFAPQTGLHHGHRSKTVAFTHLFSFQYSSDYTTILFPSVNRIRFLSYTFSICYNCISLRKILGTVNACCATKCFVFMGKTDRPVDDESGICIGGQSNRVGL